MAPQRKGTVPDKLAAKLAKVGETYQQAKAERDATIMAALRAGGSYREVAKLVGMDSSSVHSIGKAHGWPDAKEQAHRERMKTDQAYRWNYLYGDLDALRRPNR